MLTDCDPLTGILLIVIPCAVSVIFNLAHAAAIYLDDAQLQNRAASGDSTAASMVRLLSKNDRAKTAVRLTSYVCTALAAYASSVFTRQCDTAVSALVFLLAAIVFIAAAVLAPRRIAAYHPEKIAFSLFTPFKLWCLILTPITFAMGLISSLVVRLAGCDPNEEPNQITEEEIRMLVDEGEELGAIDEGEKKMINNIFEFDDRGVSEVMTHRTEVQAVPVTASLHEAIEAAMTSGNTRLPVYEEDIDSICGILYAKDLLKFVERPERFVMTEVMREPIYVPESSTCADVFSLMQKKRTQMAIIVDEYGGTYGLVTMEDLIETIVGSIQDEYDNENSEVTQLSEDEWRIDSSYGLGEAEELLGISFPDDSEADTLGGYITEQIGFVPTAGKASPCVRVGPVVFSAEESDDRRILTVRAKRDPLPEEDD